MNQKDYINNIAKWCVFSDEEVGNFQFYFKDFLQKEAERLTVFQAYQLAVLGSETQYQMRILRHRMLKSSLSDREILVNDSYVKHIGDFSGLVDFIIEKFISNFEQMEILAQYEYKKNKPYSYFTATEAQLDTKKIIKTLLKIGVCKE